MNVFKTDTKQKKLNGDIEQEVIYIRPPVTSRLVTKQQGPKGYALQLMKGMYGTRQAGRNILKIESQSSNNNQKHWKAKRVMPFQGRESDLSLEFFSSSSIFVVVRKV